MFPSFPRWSVGTRNVLSSATPSMFRVADLDHISLAIDGDRDSLGHIAQRFAKIVVSGQNESCDTVRVRSDIR